MENDIRHAYVLERMLVYLAILLVCLISGVVVFVRFFVPISYDLIFYEQYYLLSINSLEPGFKFLFHSLSVTGLPFKLALYVLPLAWVVILAYKRTGEWTRKELFFFILLFFGSQFFSLGILNGVRQFYSSLFILIPLLEPYVKTSRKEKVVLFVLAASFHWSSLLFFPLIFVLFKAASSKRFILNFLVIGSVIFVTVFVFKKLFIEDKYLTEFSEGRSSTLLKVAVVLIYYCITTIISFARTDLRLHAKFRFALFVILLGSSIYGELFSRLLFFFSCYEVLFSFLYINYKEKQYVGRLAYLFMFIFYNFLSLNVINVLWKQLIQG